MNVKFYCDSAYAELTGIKAKIYDLLRIVRKTPPDKRETLDIQAHGLHALVEELTAMIDRLKQECPVEWHEPKKAIEAKKMAILEKIDSFAGAENIAKFYM